MKTIISFFKSHSIEFVLMLTTALLVTGLYFRPTIATNTIVLWLAMIATPSILLKVLFHFDYNERLCEDAVFIIWCFCMITTLAGQCYILGFSWDIIIFVLLDGDCFLLGLLPMLASLAATSDSYE